MRITSKYGHRNIGLKGASTFHRGIDLGRDFSKQETEILAVADGVIANNYWNNTRGWVVIIDHGNFKTLYQHLKRQSPLPKGSRVKAGQHIGIMGASTKTIRGMAMHLHFELIYRNKSIDAEPYLKNIVEVEELTEEQVREIVREEIKEALSGNGSEVQGWAKKAWEEETAAGLTTGERPLGYMTRQEGIYLLNKIKKLFGK